MIRRAFEVITADLGQTTSPEHVLQMAIKAINDTAGPDGLIPTLLVFGTYPRLSNTSPPSPSISARAAAIRKAMTEIRRIKASRQIADALSTRNGPDTISTLQLPLQSSVKVWREGRGWTGPHTLLAFSDNQAAVVVDVNGRQATFRITAVQPYHQDESTVISQPVQLDEDHGDKAQAASDRADGDF